MRTAAVIGSINMDMVTVVERFPRAGETLTGKSFSTVPGGKGANQAVALGRLGVPVRMAGLVGSDAFGAEYVRHFEKNGVDTSLVGVSQGNTTGTATIEVNADGENHIVVVPGANGDCSMEWLDGVLGKLADADIFLLQHEIPLEVVFSAIRRLNAMGKTVILDPAPAAQVPEDALRSIDYITPNETELRAITPSLPESADAAERMEYLLSQGVGCVVHKAGRDGAFIATRGGIAHVPGFPVEAVDTTAAGDTFNAGFAAWLAMGLPLPEAARMANAAAAISVTAYGAQAGMPNMDRVRKLLG